MKPETALLRKREAFFIPEFSSDVHHEIELVIRMSKMGKFIQEAFARNYYDEIALGLDFTARDLQNDLKKKGLPWEKAKAFDGSAKVGDFVSLAECNEQEGISFLLLKNGEAVQKGNSREMLFSLNRVVAEVSRYFTLKAGDYIFTGTPAGVGPVNSGDKLEGYLAGKLNLVCSIK